MNAQKWVVAAVVTVALCFSGALLAQGTPSTPVSEGGVTPYIIPGSNPGGNRTCAEVGYVIHSNATYYSCWSAKFNYPADFPADFSDISGNLDCERNVIEVETDGTYVSFNSFPDGVGAALIKGSNDTNVYVYEPQAFTDAGLASPPNPNGEPAGLSNIGGFCWNPDEPEGPPIGCWDGETAWAAGSRYVRRGNWATYTSYSNPPKTVNLLAGQTMLAGEVTFSAPDGGVVTITIELNEGWRFAMVPVGEENGLPIFDNNVKVQHYASAPSGNPSPGLFQWKQFAEGDFTEIEVPAANFYGVHVDVEREIECPE
jgi:hypothetical protein